jgi:hypothetical protein
MSAAPLRTTARPLSSAPARQSQPERRPRLAVVPAPQRGRSIAPFALLCVAIVISALAAVLVLNTAMAQSSYSSRDIKIEIAQLHQARAETLARLEANAAPAALSQRAQELGMVPASSIGFVSLDNGQVIHAGGRR